MEVIILRFVFPLPKEDFLQNRQTIIRGPPPILWLIYHYLNKYLWCYVNGIYILDFREAMRGPAWRDKMWAARKCCSWAFLSLSCPKFHVQRFYVMNLFQEKLQCFTSKNIFTEIFVQRAVFEIMVDHAIPTSCWNLGCPKQCVLCKTIYLQQNQKYAAH